MVTGQVLLTGHNLLDPAWRFTTVLPGRMMGVRRWFFGWWGVGCQNPPNMNDVSYGCEHRTYHTTGRRHACNHVTGYVRTLAVRRGA